jgi:hypothetical protein
MLPKGAEDFVFVREGLLSCWSPAKKGRLCHHFSHGITCPVRADAVHVSSAKGVVSAVANTGLHNKAIDVFKEALISGKLVF